MKVCTKCGWQNEDEETKCFQCYADLSAETAQADTPPEENESQELDEAQPVEQTAEAESADVWFDPDMKPIEHHTEELPTPPPDAVRVVEEEIVTDDAEEEEEPVESSSRIPTWALLAVFGVLVVIIVFAGRIMG